MCFTGSYPCLFELWYTWQFMCLFAQIVLYASFAIELLRYYNSTLDDMWVQTICVCRRLCKPSNNTI